MAIDLQQERAEAHALVDQLPPDKLVAARSLLKALAEDEVDEDDELTEEDRIAIQAGIDYFNTGGEGIPFEQVVADLGFTMEEVRGETHD